MKPSDLRDGAYRLTAAVEHPLADKRHKHDWTLAKQIPPGVYFVSRYSADYGIHGLGPIQYVSIEKSGCIGALRAPVTETRTPTKSSRLVGVILASGAFEASIAICATTSGST